MKGTPTPCPHVQLTLRGPLTCPRHVQERRAGQLGGRNRLAKGERLFRQVLRFGITVRPELTDLRPEGAWPRPFPNRTKPTPARGCQPRVAHHTRTRPSALLSGLYGPLSGYPGAVGGATTLRSWMNE